MIKTLKSKGNLKCHSCGKSFYSAVEHHSRWICDECIESYRKELKLEE